MTAIENKLFSSCSDEQVQRISPKSYCLEFVHPQIDFWDMEVDISKLTFLG